MLETDGYPDCKYMTVLIFCEHIFLTIYHYAQSQLSHAIEMQLPNALLKFHLIAYLALIYHFKTNISGPIV